MITRLTILLTLALVLNSAAVGEQKKPLAESIPAGAFAYAETSGLAELIRLARGSELHESIMTSSGTQDFIASEESKELRSGIQWAKVIMRMDLWDAGEKLLGGPAAIGLYPNLKNPEKKKPAVLVLVQPEDAKAWSKQRIWTDPLLAIGAKSVGKGKVPFGVKVYETKAEEGPRTYLALHRRWVLISSDSELLLRGVNHLKLQPEGESLAANGAHLKELESRHPGEHLARAFVDTQLLSKAAGGRLGLPEKMDNPLGSLIFGGMLEMVANSKLASAAVDFEGDEFVLKTTIDADPSKLDPSFQVFFAGDNSTRNIPQIPGLIGGVTMHRDLATWYRSREHLLQAQVLPEFDKFETGLGNILPGKDIGEDVMPLIGNNFTLVSAIQDFDYLDGEPGVKLPGFALILDLAEPDPQAGEDMFQLFFQTFLSVLNLQAAEQDRQPWLIAAQDHNDTQITYARYFQKPKGEQLPTVFNFLPASARVGDQYIISSSLGMCKDLIDQMKNPSDQSAKRNSHGQLDFAGVAKALDLNRQHLVASRLNEGRDTEHAIEDIDHLFLALKHLGELTSSGTVDANGFNLQIKGNAQMKRADAIHLLWRVQAGATPEEIDRVVADGLAKTVERLIEPQPESDRFASTESVLYQSATSTGNIDSLKNWWLYRMLHTANPLAEKMALFWHNHFATSNTKVRSARHMATQNQLIRQHALGDFSELLRAMARDVAMLKWLDNNANRKRQPNENFAREVMELFTLGVGNYSEHDIKEAARAFTGWHLRNDKFWLNQSQHDDGTKSVLGETGNFGGKDVLRICLAQEACPRFLAKKLLETFVASNPDKATIDALAGRIRKHEFNMAKVMGELLQSEIFFAPESRRAIIKSPTDLVVGAYRALGNRAKLPPSVQLMAALGQNLFEPPTVKGWEGGRLWINATSMLQRSNFAADLVSGDRYGRIAKPKSSINYEELLLGRKLPGTPGGRDLLGRIQFLMSTPEYQLL